MRRWTVFGLLGGVLVGLVLGVAVGLLVPHEAPVSVAPPPPGLSVWMDEAHGSASGAGPWQLRGTATLALPLVAARLSSADAALRAEGQEPGTLVFGDQAETCATWDVPLPAHPRLRAGLTVWYRMRTATTGAVAMRFQMYEDTVGHIVIHRGPFVGTQTETATWQPALVLPAHAAPHDVPVTLCRQVRAQEDAAPGALVVSAVRLTVEATP